MLCHVMLCYVMLCYVMLCYVMLCYVMLCYVVLCYVLLGDIIPCLNHITLPLSCYVSYVCYMHLHVLFFHKAVLHSGLRDWTFKKQKVL